MNDPLDQMIDELLASRPLRADDACKAHVLEVVATEPLPRQKCIRVGALLKFALPLAAAIAVATVLLNQSTQEKPTQQASALSIAEAEEIFLLENGLEGLASLESNEVPADELLQAFEILYLEI